MYGIGVRQSDTLQSVPSDISSPAWHHTYSLQYYCLNSLCCNLHPRDYFVTATLCLSIPSPLSPSPPPLPSGTRQPVSSVSMSLFLFCLFIYGVLSIPQRSKIIWYLSSFGETRQDHHLSSFARQYWRWKGLVGTLRQGFQILWVFCSSL